MLATWTVFGLTDIHVMNANRTLMGAAVNGIAAVLFIVARKIWWPQTLVMLVAPIIGGYVGARMARKVNPRYVRAVVISDQRGDYDRVLPAAALGLSSTGFSLWILVLARTEPHRLKPVLPNVYEAFSFAYTR